MNAVETACALAAGACRGKKMGPVTVTVKLGLEGSHVRCHKVRRDDITDTFRFGAVEQYPHNCFRLCSTFVRR